MNFLKEPWKYYHCNTSAHIGLLFFRPDLPKCQVRKSKKRLQEVIIARNLWRREAFSSTLSFRKWIYLAPLLSPTDALNQLNRSVLKDLIALAKPFGDHQLPWIMQWLSLLFKWLRSKEFEGIIYLWDWPTSSISIASPRMNQYSENLWPQIGI